MGEKLLRMNRGARKPGQEPEPIYTRVDAMGRKYQMTDRQHRFCLSYIADPSKPIIHHQRTAGFTASHGNQGMLLMKNEAIRSFIAAATKPAAEKLEITAERVLQGLAEIAFANILDYVTIGEDGLAEINLSDVSRQQASAIAEITTRRWMRPAGGKDADGHPIMHEVAQTKIKLSEKRQALEVLARYLKLIGGSDDDRRDFAPITLIIEGAPVRIRPTIKGDDARNITPPPQPVIEGEALPKRKKP